MSVPGQRDKFLGLEIAVHGPALYLDFELDAAEQHRRARQLALGMRMKIPEDLLYVSTLGSRTEEAIDFALKVCEEHGPVLVVLDSLGPAMLGDMNSAQDIIEFHNRYIAPFRELGVTPVLVDHQARQQPGEHYQAKGAFGSSYKEHLSRSMIQVESGDRSAKKGTLTVRLRHKKTNFSALRDPFEVTLTFSAEKVSVSHRELKASEKAQESTLNATDRVLAALQDGPAYPDDIAEATNLARATVKNAVGALKRESLVETTGERKGLMEELRIAGTSK
jgi:hypothetical protein